MTHLDGTPFSGTLLPGETVVLIGPGETLPDSAEVYSSPVT